MLQALEPSGPFFPQAIPAAAGIGLRAPHYREVLAQRPKVAWFEVHSENFFGAGGAALRALDKIRQDYPLSLHGVSLSLGSADPLSIGHLHHLQRVVACYEPALVSEHLCWVSTGGRYLHDLLPMPYTEAMLKHVVPRIQAVQESLGRPILIENVSAYLRFADEEMPEWVFLAEVARRSGCGILLDINNLYVNSVNLGVDPGEYLRNLPVESIQEIHLAGYSVQHVRDREILVDTHNLPVWPAVWQLYERALRRFGRPLPTLIEWDADIPPLAELLAEAQKAQTLLEAIHE